MLVNESLGCRYMRVKVSYMRRKSMLHTYASLTRTPPRGGEER